MAVSRRRALDLLGCTVVLAGNGGLILVVYELLKAAALWPTGINASICIGAALLLVLYAWAATKRTMSLGRNPANTIKASALL